MQCRTETDFDLITEHAFEAADTRGNSNLKKKCIEQMEKCEWNKNLEPTRKKNLKSGIPLGKATARIQEK